MPCGVWAMPMGVRGSAPGLTRTSAWSCRGPLGCGPCGVWAMGVRDLPPDSRELQRGHVEAQWGVGHGGTWLGPGTHENFSVVVYRGPVGCQAGCGPWGYVARPRDSRELQRGRVEVQRRPVALPHVQRDVLRLEAVDHRARRLVHQLLSESEPPVRPLHCLQHAPPTDC